MDEKDNNEFTAQNTTEENESAINEEKTEQANIAEENNDDGDTLDQLTTDVSENEMVETPDGAMVEATKVKNKHFIQTPLIIAGAILLCAVIGFVVWKVFFNTSIEGSWVVQGSIATSDEAQTIDDAKNMATYYTFTNDGKVSLKLGTMDMQGTYTTKQNDDGSQTVSVSVSYFFTGDYTYTVTGNNFTGRVLTLTSTSTTSGTAAQSFAFDSATQPEQKLTPSSDFEVNNDILGSWNESDYNMTYTFNADGTTHINENDMLSVDGTYVVNDSTITITYKANGDLTLDVEYSFDSDTDTLVLSGLGYTKVSE